MSVFYLDASALVKRYVNEPGSGWLRSRGMNIDDYFASTTLISSAVNPYNSYTN